MKKFVIVIAVILFMVILLLFGMLLIAIQRGNTDNKEKIAASLEPSRQKTAEDESDKAAKVLIVYFSLTGNTKQVANIMEEFTNGVVFEIQPDFDYSKVQSKAEMGQLGKQQVNEGFRPELKNTVADIDTYDLIIIGSPVWWYSVTPPVMSFLSQYNLEGKKVAPFCTCGSVAGDFFTQFEDAIPDAEVLNGLTLTEAELQKDEESKEKIKVWLEDLGVYRTYK